MKKRSRKLALNRETLHNLEPRQTQEAAGAALCTSNNCTNSCQYTAPNFTQCGYSGCVCPLTDTVDPVIC